ncbi:MAG: hypothetical protein J5590_04150 [Clostridia bacterium]|nr:hypothetical protein [Clostridia bacterium]
MEYDIVECISCWYDLLGFGTPFIEAEWNLHNEVCSKNYERIKNVEHKLIGGLSINVHKLFINDGVACNIDTQNEPIHRVADKLELLITDYNAINYVEKKEGYPGARGVLTCGYRFAYESTDVLDNCYEIKYFHPRYFQMNTAYSKAYIMESNSSKFTVNGAKEKITNAYLYIDYELYLYFLKNINKDQGDKITIKYESDKIIVDVYFFSKHYATLVFENKRFEFAYAGIKTKLYKLLKMKSEAELDAIDNAYKHAQMYSKMDE